MVHRVGSSSYAPEGLVHRFGSSSYAPEGARPLLSAHHVKRRDEPGRSLRCLLHPDKLWLPRQCGRCSRACRSARPWQVRYCCLKSESLPRALARQLCTRRAWPASTLQLAPGGPVCRNERARRSGSGACKRRQRSRLERLAASPGGWRRR